jgi:glyoxylase-like metal-dependent hydrolase (beta-lactamase superfamily II)
MTSPLSPAATGAALQDLTVLQRGWLSSNQVVMHGGGHGAVVVDTGHVVHREQTVGLLRHALAGEALKAVVNTHLHSDHCGGNAAVQRAFGCRIVVPPGDFAAVQAWDEQALSYRATGQMIERFVPDTTLSPGDSLDVGQRRWQALAAPGHDPHSLMLYDSTHGVLISADALWENGFGVVFPELDGEQAFTQVGETLDLIESLNVGWVVPGHGAPFQDSAGALRRARERLGAFQTDPGRHSRYAMRVLLKYHMMEIRQQTLPDLLDWVTETSLCRRVWARLDRPEGSLTGFGSRLVDDLVGSGALRRQDDWVFDAG